MNQTILATLGALRLGEPVTHAALSVLPLFLDAPQAPDYLTLTDALGQGLVTVSEISESGSVPDLIVVNQAGLPLLILDGEELSGAKQNRCLNTSVLLAAHSKTVVPVSCTEHGRWSHTRDIAFAASGNVMEQKTRARKTARVHEALRSRRAYSSPESQREVWSSIDELSVRNAAPSPTSAMRDVFTAKADDLESAVSALPAQDGQVGSVFAVGGRVLGVDLLTRLAAYRQVHEKLVRSYALAAQGQETNGLEDTTASASEFLTRIGAGAEQIYPSVGLGEDHRLTGAGQVGSALVYDGAVIHLACFSVEEADAPSHRPARMADLRQRRAARQDGG